MGMPASTALTTKVIIFHKPKLVAMIGIAAGVDDDGKRKLGDLLVPSLTFDYGAGKIEADGTLHPDPCSLSISADLKSQIIKWKDAESSKFSHIVTEATMVKPHDEDKSHDGIVIHLGPLASGAAVVNNEDQIKIIQQHSRKLIGIDMEAYGVHFACHATMNKNVEFICMKAISDFAKNKNKKYREYAAFVAARMFFEFIRKEWEDLSIS